MIYSIPALTAAAQAAIEHQRSEWESRQLQQTGKLSAEREAWLESWRDQWKAAARRINSAMSRGFPVTKDMLPRDAHGGMAFFYPSLDARPLERDFRPPAELVNLITILRTLAGDTVNTNALRELGVSRDSMRLCVQHMAAGTIS